MLGRLRVVITVMVLGLLAYANAAAPVAAQDDEANGFPLVANTAYCEPGYLGPFVDCTPWDGVTITYTSADGTFSETCTTDAGERTASCSVPVPFRSTVTASIDPAVVPAGYTLEQAPSQTFEIPDGMPDGEFGGPVFVLLPEVQPTAEPTVEPTVAPTVEPTVSPPTEETVLLRAWACPDASPDEPFTTCEAIIGATYRIDANGVETDDSPVTTVQETGIGPGVAFSVPAGADLVVTQTGGAPDGYVPAAGFNPFAGNVDDLPRVGFGGESTGPGLDFINVPDETGDAVETPIAPTETPGAPEAARAPVELPGTGSGAPGDRTGAPIGWLVVAVLLAIAGGAILRRSYR